MINWWKKKDGKFRKLPSEGQQTLIKTSGVNGRMFVATFETRRISGNDTVPYGWNGPGPFSHFGSDVIYWADVNEPRQ